MYALLAETDEVVINFPKMRKHTDGRFMKELVLDAIRALYKANAAEAHSDTRRTAQEEIIYLLGCYRTILRRKSEGMAYADVHWRKLVIKKRYNKRVLRRRAIRNERRNKTIWADTVRT